MNHNHQVLPLSSKRNLITYSRDLHMLSMISLTGYQPHEILWANSLSLNSRHKILYYSFCQMTLFGALCLYDPALWAGRGNPTASEKPIRYSSNIYSSNPYQTVEWFIQIRFIKLVEVSQQNTDYPFDYATWKFMRPKSERTCGTKNYWSKIKRSETN